MTSLEPTIPAGRPWDAGLWVVRTLQQAGYQACFVGGCVRDLLLARPVQDVDVATEARPEQVEACFPRTISVGKAFGVVVVPTADGGQVEVATFRRDGVYIDGRRPDEVAFSTAEEDVARRDFTINALLLDPLVGRVIDHVGGIADLRDRRLRAVGDAAARLAEDRLRVLRGLRFLAQLQLTAEPATWQALCTTALTGLSAERIMDEWFKGLRGPHRGAWLQALRASGQLAAFCPPLAAALGDGDAAGASAALDRLLAGDPPEVAAALWLLPAGVDALPWLERQPLSRERAGRIAWLLRHAADGVLESMPLAQRLRTLSAEGADQLVRLLRLAMPAGDERSARIAAWREERRAAGPFAPWVRAGDLLALGFRPGPLLGQALREIEDAQLEARLPDREAALAWARRRLERPDQA